jgi:lysophospholipase L1-like esterase
MERWHIQLGRLVGAAVGAFAGVLAVQFMRLRRAEFLPGWPGFRVNHLVAPMGAPASGDPLTLVVLGDSTAAGVGVSRPQDALPYLLARRIADAEARPVRVISYGWAGARAADLPRQQVAHAAGAGRRPKDAGPFLRDADVVAIVIGSNDATHRTPPARYRDSLRQTFEAVRACATGARIVLCGIPRFRGVLRAFEPLIFLADQYARFLRPISRAEAARAGAAYADIHARVPPMIAGRRDVLSSDQFHPSAVLYDAWARVMFEALDGGAAPTSELTPAPLEPAGA